MSAEAPHKCLDDTLFAAAADPPQMAGLEPGALIDRRYRLLRFVARGGMGEVWAARHLLLNRIVALKFVVVQSDELRDMLLAEAKTLASLRHPAVVEVYDCGLLDRAPFLVMELLDGESLGAHLERNGPMEARAAVQLLLPVVDGLAVAHALGIVHRDLKPENLLLRSEGGIPVAAKLIDFGIAYDKRVVHAPERWAMGTPAYMAPEQLCSEDVHASTDIWALGVTLYETLTGNLPFPDDGNVHELTQAIISAPIAYPRTCAKLDRELWRFLTDCLRKKASDRVPSMAEAAVRLRRWLDTTAPTIDRERAPPPQSGTQSPSAAPPFEARPSLFDEMIRKKLK